MERALFSFRTGCDTCGDVNNFIAALGVVCGDNVFFAAECQGCYETQLIQMHYLDFMELFCGGDDEED